MSIEHPRHSATQEGKGRHWVLRVVTTMMSLALVYFAVDVRRPYLVSVLKEQDFGLEPGFEGLALSTAVAILWFSFVIIILLLHGLARFVDTRWTGGGNSLLRRPATLGVHLAVAVFLLSAIRSSEIDRPLGAVLPNAVFFVLLVGAAALGWWARRDVDGRSKYGAAATAAGFVVLTALGMGRWF